MRSVPMPNRTQSYWLQSKIDLMDELYGCNSFKRP
jgi:hypothetical protein